MLKHFIGIVSLLFSNNLSGQQDYYEYHTIIKSAEEALSLEKFDIAIANYERAFKQFDYVFLKDYVLAAQVAAINHEYTKSLEFIDFALQNGYSSKCFQRLIPFRGFIKQQDWEEIERKEIRYKEDYLNSIDTNLLIEFSKRYSAEQDEKSGIHYDKVLSLNYNRIATLMDSMPFVSERLIGYDDESIAPNQKNLVSGLNSCCACNAKVIVTLKHVSNPFRNISYDKFLNAIKDGYLHPLQFAHIYLATNKEELKLAIEVPKLSYRSKRNLKKTNADRAAIGLNSIEIEQRLKKVCRKHKIKLSFGYMTSSLIYKSATTKG